MKADMKGQRVLVDTMVVIEAHRIGCWNALLHSFQMETVEQCIVECATGYRRRKGYVALDQQRLRSQIKVHEVTDVMRAGLLVADPGAAFIDAGERDLLSYAMTQEEVLLLCSPDKAAISSAFRLNLFNRLVALEELALVAGVRKHGYRQNHTKEWLTNYKTKVQLGIL